MSKQITVTKAQLNTLLRMSAKLADAKRDAINLNSRIVQFNASIEPTLESEYAAAKKRFVVYQKEFNKFYNSIIQ